MKKISTELMNFGATTSDQSPDTYIYILGQKMVILGIFSNSFVRFLPKTSGNTGLCYTFLEMVKMNTE